MEGTLRHSKDNYRTILYGPVRRLTHVGRSLIKAIIVVVQPFRMIASNNTLVVEDAPARTDYSSSMVRSQRWRL